MLADRDIDLDIDDKALAWLADAGYDPVYGARPLKRVIQRALQNPLATLLLEGRIADGQAVHISADEHGLLIDGISASTQTPSAGAAGGTGSAWASQRTVH
jgi:ATP-dependent Clp protease ATP-binding subunit ClpB